MVFKDVIHKFIVISVATLLLIVAYSSFGLYYNKKVIKSTDETVSDIYSTCKCDFTGLRITAYDCSDLSYPVLGGVDLVDYFTTFKLSSGVYNESLIGSYGNQKYSHVYNSYTFYFTSKENKELFALSPESYLPQYGGFCALGVSNEFCPRYPWSSSCLGPAGNWGAWTVINEKLYFFLDVWAKTNFLEDPTSYITVGDKRWNYWFPDGTIPLLSTKCYETDPTYLD